MEYLPTRSTLNIVLMIAMKFGHLIEVFISGLQIDTPIRKYDIISFTFIMEARSWVGPNRSNVGCADTPCRPTHCWVTLSALLQYWQHSRLALYETGLSKCPI